MGSRGSTGVPHCIAMSVWLAQGLAQPLRAPRISCPLTLSPAQCRAPEGALVVADALRWPRTPSEH